ncbi:MAG: substrate-binding domain-containing protein [Hydrogeniiclostridium sp.]
MNTKTIPIISEPMYCSTHWYQEIYQEIENTAAHYNLSLSHLLCEDKIASPPLPPGGTEPVLLLGTSQNWIFHMSSVLSQKHIRTLCVGGNQSLTVPGVSSIHLDYQLAMSEIAGYLAACGKKQTALIGINPASITDLEKMKGFQIAAVEHPAFSPAGDSVFWNNGSISRCVASFLHRSEQFDSAVCSNDIVALELLRQMTNQGKTEPLFLISFGNMILDELVEPSLTTVSLSYKAVGRQAVELWKVLAHAPEINSLSCLVGCRIFPRGTTGYQPVMSKVVYEPPKEELPNLFCQDASVESLFCLEELFARMDLMDCRILKGIQERKTYEHLAETMNISDGTVKYRLKKMQKILSCRNKDELLARIEEYLGSDVLKKFECLL